MYPLKLCSLVALSISVEAQTGNDTKNLLTKLFTTDGYNKNIRPRVNQSHKVFIYLDFHLNSVVEFDEQEESLKTAGYLEAYWLDEYLTWNPNDYNNVTDLFIPQDEIWKPDLSLGNTFAAFKGLGSSYLNVVVSYNGLVQWNPFQILQSTCAVNIKHFPFDTQKCDIKFTAWSYTNLQVEIKRAISGHITEGYEPNAAWDLISATATEVISAEPAVIFTLNLKRKPKFFLINIISPVILLSLLNIFTFMLPVESGEKAGFSVTVFLALAVFLTILSDQLPNNSDTVSLLAVYLSLMTGLSTFIVVACLAQVRLSIRKESEQPVTGLYLDVVKLYRGVSCRNFRRKTNVVTPSEENEKDLSEFKDDDDTEPEVITWLNARLGLPSLLVVYCVYNFMHISYNTFSRFAVINVKLQT